MERHGRRASASAIRSLCLAVYRRRENISSKLSRRARPVISSLRRILRVSFRVVTRLSPPLPCSNYLPSFPPSLFPSALASLSARVNPTLSGRNSSTLRVERWRAREVGLRSPCRARGGARIPRLVQEARTRTVHKTGRAGGGHHRGSVSGGVVSCPSCSTASVVACHARDSESTGQSCFTSRRFADSVPRQCPVISPLFFFPLIPSRITPGECLSDAREVIEHFVGERYFFLSFFRRKTRSKTMEIKRMARFAAFFVTHRERRARRKAADGNSHARGKKFRNSLRGIGRWSGHVIAISCLSVIENLCLPHARKRRRHAYARGKKGA